MLLSASVKRVGVSRMRDFFYLIQYLQSSCDVKMFTKVYSKIYHCHDLLKGKPSYLGNPQTDRQTSQLIGLTG